ncbi:hypothetical protein BH10BDE1_BH10BDE1_34690 [soil metagenome]
MEISFEQKAKLEWKKRSLQAHVDAMAEQQRDRAFACFGIKKQTIDPAYRGWLKVARFASLLSTNEVARRLGISRPAYSRSEERELRGAITISLMREIADAMNCDFVYELRPREGAFTEKIWKQICPIAAQHPKFWRRALAVSPEEFAFISETEMLEPATRRALHWTERLRPK